MGKGTIHRPQMIAILLAGILSESHKLSLILLDPTSNSNILNVETKENNLQLTF